MKVTNLLLASLLATSLNLGVRAQEADHEAHHPEAAAQATTPTAPAPMQGESSAMPPAGPMMGQEQNSMPAGQAGARMCMMPGCMGMMRRMAQGGMPPNGMAQSGMPHDGIAAHEPDDPVEGAFAAINRRMHRDMAVEATGNPDVDFAMAMMAHHQGAIDMAKVIMGFGEDPEIRKLAQEIMTEQEREVAFLQQWLAKQPAR